MVVSFILFLLVLQFQERKAVVKKNKGAKQLALTIALLDLVSQVISFTNSCMYWFAYEKWMSWSRSENHPYSYIWFIQIASFTQMLAHWLFIARYVKTSFMLPLLFRNVHLTSWLI